MEISEQQVGRNTDIPGVRQLVGGSEGVANSVCAGERHETGDRFVGGSQERGRIVAWQRRDALEAN